MNVSIDTIARLRETAIIDEIIKNLSLKQLHELLPLIEKSVIDGRSRWSTEILPAIFGKEKASIILSKFEEL